MAYVGVGVGDCDAGELGKRSECYDVYDWRVLYEHDELYECAWNRGEVQKRYKWKNLCLQS